MVKADIVNEVARATDITKVKAEIAVDAVFDAMRVWMQRGERIELRGFGVFQVKPRKRGIGRNPRWPAADRHAVEAAIEAASLGPRLFGSCALSLMLVATGRLKGYIEPRVGGLWDCAAGLALCRVAGLPTSFRLHPDGTVDVLAGKVFGIAEAAGWRGEILKKS